MIRNEEEWLSTIDAFQSAAVGAQSWETALRGFAKATGSRSAQLAGINSNNSVFFNIAVNVDPALVKISDETASINPRVKAAYDAPVLKIMSDYDFIAPEECRRNPFYQEVLRPWDIPFVCITNLEKREGAYVGLCAVRSHKDGHITAEQREMFAALAPYVRGAVRMEEALERHGTAVLTGTMEAISIPVFICDRNGRVKSLTQAAEALVASGRGLQLKCGHLQASRSDDAKALNAAIDAAVLGSVTRGTPILSTVVIRGNDPADPVLVMDVFALPSQPYQFTFTPRVLVVARGPRDSKARRMAVLRTAYALTSAEAEVAQHIVEGHTVDIIAANRRVSAGTVRAQIKTIMTKVGVSRQVELIVRLNQL